MKTRIIGLLALAFGLSALLWTACDKIPDNERLIQTSTGLGWPSDMPEPAVPDLAKGKTIVLEDFTGVRCVNCPKAAEIAHELQGKYGERMIAVELHAETLSIGELSAPHEGDVDLRSADAKVFAEYWAISSLPKGLINRQQAAGLPRVQWSGVAEAVHAETPLVAVEATGRTSQKVDGLWVWAKGHFEEAYNTGELGDIHVIAMVLEDGFKVKQTSANGVEEGYPHDHVLRQVMGGDAWGVKMEATDGMVTDFEYKGSVLIDPSWNIENLSVAVLVCNAKTKEILNATKVIPEKK